MGRRRARAAGRGARAFKRSAWLLAAVTCACTKSGSHFEEFAYCYNNKQSFMEKMASIAVGVDVGSRREVFEALADGLIDAGKVRAGRIKVLKGVYGAVDVETHLTSRRSSGNYKYIISFGFDLRELVKNCILGADIKNALDDRFEPTRVPLLERGLSFVSRARPNVVVAFSYAGGIDDLCAESVSITKHPLKNSKD